MGNEKKRVKRAIRSKGVGHICYVCGVKITELRGGFTEDTAPIRIPKDRKTGQERWRHRTCEPGSVKWMNSEVGKNSPVYPYYKKCEKKEVSPRAREFFKTKGKGQYFYPITERKEDGTMTKKDTTKKQVIEDPKDLAAVGRIKYLSHMDSMTKNVEKSPAWSVDGAKLKAKKAAGKDQVNITTPDGKSHKVAAKAVKEFFAA